MRLGAAGFQHVLRIEMRTVAIRRRDIVENRQLLLVPHLRKIVQGRIETEKSIEIDRRGYPAFGQSEGTAQRCIIGIAMGGNRRQTVQTSAQDDNDEALVRGKRGIGES